MCCVVKEKVGSAAVGHPPHPSNRRQAGFLLCIYLEFDDLFLEKAHTVLAIRFHLTISHYASYKSPSAGIFLAETDIMPPLNSIKSARTTSVTNCGQRLFSRG